jgi:transposase
MKIFLGLEVLVDATTKKCVPGCNAVDFREIPKFGNYTKFKPRRLQSSLKNFVLGILRK